MNDFTKEELQENIDLMVRAYGENVRYLTIAKKLQSLIDNYCEHQIPIYIVTGFDGCDVHIEKCFKTKEAAEKYKEEIYFKANDGHENEEYNFSVHEWMLIK